MEPTVGNTSQQTWKTNRVISIQYDSYLMSAVSHLRLTDEWSHEGGMKQNKVLVFFVQLFVKYAGDLHGT